MGIIKVQSWEMVSFQVTPDIKSSVECMFCALPKRRKTKNKNLSSVIFSFNIY